VGIGLTQAMWVIQGMRKTAQNSSQPMEMGGGTLWDIDIGEKIWKS